MLNSMTRFGVPIFILCSGAMILQKNYDDIKNFFSKRLSRIVVPFIFWATIYEFHKGITDIQIMLNDLFFQNVMYHFWFIYMILTIYLFVPIISDILGKLTQYKLNYIFILWLFFSAIVSFEYLMMQGFSGNYFLVEFIGYFIAGWLIHNQKIKFLHLNGLATFFSVCGIIGFLGGLVILYTTKLQSYYESFFEPYFIAVVIGSLLIFKYFRENEDFFQRYKRYGKFLSQLSILTYGGYLIHILVLDRIKDLFFAYNGQMFVAVHPVIATLACAVLTSVVSLLIIKIFSLIPILRRFT